MDKLYVRRYTNFTKERLSIARTVNDATFVLLAVSHRKLWLTKIIPVSKTWSQT